MVETESAEEIHQHVAWNREMWFIRRDQEVTLKIYKIVRGIDRIDVQSIFPRAGEFRIKVRREKFKGDLKGKHFTWGTGYLEQECGRGQSLKGIWTGTCKV